MKVYGYARVSTREQNADRQIIALLNNGLKKREIFVDQKSGKDFERPAYQDLIQVIQEGDLLVIKSIDRLGRDYDEVMDQWRKITKEIGADIRILDMPLLDTTVAKDLLGNFIADLVLQVLSFVSQNERENIRQRQAEGIAAAKAKGVRFGRPEKSLPHNFKSLIYQWRKKKITTEELCTRCDMSLSVIYKRIKENNL